MKSRTLIFLFLSIVFTIRAQDEQQSFNNTIFTAQVSSVCEETPDDNPCAGYDIFLTLRFNNDEVVLIEKNISSCNEETIAASFIYNWELKEENIHVYTKPDDIKYTYFKTLELVYENNKIIGSIKHDNGKTKVYSFLEL